MSIKFKTYTENETIIRGYIGGSYDLLDDYVMYDVSVERNQVERDEFAFDLAVKDFYQIVTKNRDLKAGDLVIAEGELCMMTGFCDNSACVCAICGNPVSDIAPRKFVLKVNKFHDTNRESDDGWLEHMIRRGWNTNIVLRNFDITNVRIEDDRTVYSTNDLMFSALVTASSIRKLFPDEIPLSPKLIKGWHEDCCEGHIVLLQKDSDWWRCDKCGYFNSIDFKLPIVCDISPHNRLWE